MDLLDYSLQIPEEISGRLFLANLTSSSSVSSTYATFIVLAISFGLAAIGALIYYGLLAMTQGGSSYGGQFHFKKRKRDANDNQDYILRLLSFIDKDLTRIVDEQNNFEGLNHLYKNYQ